MHDNRSQGVPSVATVRDQNVSVNAVVISDGLKAVDNLRSSLNLINRSIIFLSSHFYSLQ
jgi:hypothetical protein